MKKASLTILFASMTVLGTPAIADDQMDFATVTKVQYVTDCMQANNKLNVYEGINKCSCVVDKLDEAFTETEFVDVSTAYMYRNLPADRGAQFRDDKGVNTIMDEYEEVSASAYKECKIQ